MKRLILDLLAGASCIALIATVFVCAISVLIAVPLASGWGAAGIAFIGTVALVIALAMAMSVGNDLRDAERRRSTEAEARMREL